MNPKFKNNKNNSYELHSKSEFQNKPSNKYSFYLSEESRLVKLDHDVARYFKSSAAVNRALRAIISASTKNTGNK